MTTDTPHRMDGLGPGPQILIVEDEVDLATTCIRFLRRIGYRPRVTYTGAEALAAITAEPPDLVVTDLWLPGAIDGLAIVRHVRQHDPPIPVILCTAQASNRTQQEAFAAGATRYLPKPFSLAELRAAIDGALGQGQSAVGQILA